MNKKHQYIHKEEVADYTPDMLSDKLSEIFSSINKDVINSILLEEERIAIIIAVSYIEEMIEKILDRRFICNRSIQFNPFKDGPLETLSAKIKIAHLIGIFDEKTYNLLVKVKNLRNDCAHQITLDFGSGRTQGDKLDGIVSLLKDSILHRMFQEGISKKPTYIITKNLTAQNLSEKKFLIPLLTIMVGLHMILDLNANHIKHCRGFNIIAGGETDIQKPC